MKPGRIVLAVVGVLVALISIALIGGGAGLLWANATQRNNEGFFVSPEVNLSTDGYALSSADIDLGAQPGDWFPSGHLATVLIEAASTTGSEVFVGVGPRSEVDQYLAGVAYSQVADIGQRLGDVVYRDFSGDEPVSTPGQLDFWVESVQGVGTQSMTWELEQGEWTVVIMNADAAAGVEVEAVGGAATELLVPVAVALLMGGLILATGAAVLLVVAVRTTGQPDAAPARSRAADVGPYPVLLEGELDSGLSRWLWLVKWLLSVPHFVVLFFLWTAFAVLTVVVFFAILFTGRYPRSIFDFNVGVMRWTWRVSYYSYGALGTDQYPPFTLADVDYPARFDVAYPEQLSRGLVLVKWWLLAIPQYLIVGLFTSGLVWWVTDIGVAGDTVLEIGGGLIGILVLIAGFALTFVGRYPQGLYDLVVGLNRWCYRVWVYAALMRDEYPPFRLDTGGAEPPPPTSPTPGTGGGTVSSERQTTVS